MVVKGREGVLQAKSGVVRNDSTTSAEASSGLINDAQWEVEFPQGLKPNT